MRFKYTANRLCFGSMNRNAKIAPEVLGCMTSGLPYERSGTEILKHRGGVVYGAVIIITQIGVLKRRTQHIF